VAREKRAAQLEEARREVEAEKARREAWERDVAEADGLASVPDSRSRPKSRELARR
jgi:hypothetical protein